MVNMLEEGFVTGTEKVQARFSIRSLNKPVAGTLAVAGELHLALPAVLGQRVLLVLAELPLFIQPDKLHQSLLADVAEKKLWFDKMIARIEIAIMFQR